ncbi:hypothetical protein [Paenibacillus sp. 481]|uniref:hypothetical protein n=1 Tax=Paenibacillus sp. 481 TaxID=2835869 RepID=UPI001E60365B|nr:hypothetical protein [Paenibacillus sp. 481]UHA73278.1 hypothetical protein KIK04_22320 [Paenibacillus sp. 481]
MNSQDELIQYLQKRLQDGQTTINELCKAAYELHKQLHRKKNSPPIKSKNSVIGILDEHGAIKSDCELLPEYYKEKKRIEFLLLWVTQVLPILQLLRGVGKLPLFRNSRVEKEADYETYVTNKLKSYMDVLSSLKTGMFLSEDDIKTTGDNCNDLLAAIGRYLEGFPEAAFNKLKCCTERIEGLNLNPLTNRSNEPGLKLFKMRLGSSNRTYSSKDMFHIPFEERGLVKTNRYSIPGLPCVYLGSTPLTCWEEMGKPDLNTTHTSLFLPMETLSFFDISIPPTAMADHLTYHVERSYGVKDLTEVYDMVRTYLILWPLIACCSIQVMNPNDTFKPEYIVSQLLLQWVQQSGKYDGVRYFSTKIDNYTHLNFQMYRNFAFPVKERKNKGHCDKLYAKFIHITNAAPWQVFQLHKGRGETAMSEQGTELEFMPGISFRYNLSDFGRLETFLLSVMEAEMRKG